MTFRLGTLVPCLFLLLLFCSFAGAADQSSANPQIQSANIRIEFDRNLRSRVIARFDNKDTTLGAFTNSESIVAAGKRSSEFPLASQKGERITDSVGAGEQLTLTGKSGTLLKTVTVVIYDDFPAMAFFDVQYTNSGTTRMAIAGWTNNAYSVNVQKADVHGPSEQNSKNSRNGPPFWSYQSGSYEKRPDWVVPVRVNFQQDNFLGMNASDYGGGTPVIDIWRRDVGIAVGHVEKKPKLASLPVSMPDASHALIAVRAKHLTSLEPGESLHTFRTFVAVHQGDYFRTLADYRRFMMTQGFQMASPPDDAYGAIWCAWGYGRKVQPKQIYDTLPTVKRLGFTWVTIDDGWQNNVGDWQLDPKKFPNGDADMKALVDRIHQEGFRAQLWWSPMSAVPNSKVYKDHPRLPHREP